MCLYSALLILQNNSELIPRNRWNHEIYSAVSGDNGPRRDNGYRFVSIEHRSEVRINKRSALKRMSKHYQQRISITVAAAVITAIIICIAGRHCTILTLASWTVLSQDVRVPVHPVSCDDLFVIVPSTSNGKGTYPTTDCPNVDSTPWPYTHP